MVIGLYGLRTWDYSRAWANDLTVFTAAAAAQPDSAKAQRMLGGALVEAGRPGEAVAAFRRAEAIVRRPGTPQERLVPALVEQGVALEKLGLTADARRLYEEVLLAHPGHSDARWRLGVVEWMEGDRAAAVSSWQWTVAENPGHARAWNDLGIAASLAGDLDGARLAWERATVADPNLASAWYRLGNLHERRGELGPAREAWGRFLDTDPGKYPELKDEVRTKMSRTATTPGVPP